jgi:antitoxin (DNA-binding transcriptional repressor) of toxin-antitoxin stability system
MQTVGSFQAKTHLSELLKQIEEKGETIAITRHGHVIALLTPPPKENPTTLAIETIRKNRKGVTLGKKLSIKTLIAEGRR